MPQRSFHPGLEGLRGVSVLAVLLFHAETTWLPGGFLGVSTFFTLSGFLITGLLVHEWDRTQKIRLSHFWARRLRRLLPASLLALLAIAILGAEFGDSTQRDRLSGDGLSALFYFSNWWLIVTGADYDSLMGSPSAIQHFWSLSIEEQYYFVYPLLAYAFFRATRGSHKAFAAFLAVACVTCWVWMAWLASTDVATARLYYGTDTRAGELLAGGVLALLVWKRPVLPDGPTRWVVLLAGLIGIAITVRGWIEATVESNDLYEGGFALYTLGSMALIAAAIQSGGPVRALLSWAAIRWLGRISYGAYVYHWPIFLFIDDNVIRFGLTLLCADLSYRLIEEPIRQGKMILGWRRFAVPPLAIGAVVLAFVWTVPETSSMSGAKTTATATTQPDPLAPKPRIAVFGGSLSRDIGEGLTEWSKRSGKAEIDNQALRGCGIARGAWPESEPRKRVHCEKWPRIARAALEKFRPDVVLVVTSWDLVDRQLPEWDDVKAIGDPDFDRWMLDQYAEALDVFQSTGSRVVWMTTPCFRSPNGEKVGIWDPKRSDHMNNVILPALAADRGGTLTILDLDAALCPGGQFTNSLFGIEPFRPDGVHFSPDGKLWVGTWVGEALVGSRPD